MAQPKIFAVPVSLNGNELLNFSPERLATAPVTTFPGRAYFDTTLNSLRVRNAADTNWIDIGSLPPGLFKIKGVIADANTNPAYPASPAEGDVYLITTTKGTVGTTEVEPGDQLVYVAGTWVGIEKNQIRATETVEGYTRLSTQAETNAGTDDTTAITPLKLATYLATIDAILQIEAGLTGDGTTTDFPVLHPFSSQFVSVKVYNAANREIITDVEATSSTTVTVGMLPAPAPTDTFTVVVLGPKA